MVTSRIEGNKDYVANGDIMLDIIIWKENFPNLLVDLIMSDVYDTRYERLQLLQFSLSNSYLIRK